MIMKRLKLSHPADDLVLTTSETGAKDEDQKNEIQPMDIQALTTHIFFTRKDTIIISFLFFFCAPHHHRPDITVLVDWA